jgi:hypothetical protein
VKPVTPVMGGPRWVGLTAWKGRPVGNNRIVTIPACNIVQFVLRQLLGRW